MILAIVAYLDMELFQMDVKPTFLNGELKEDKCMLQSDGFQVDKSEYKVYKFKKSLCNLKQFSRQWHLKFYDMIIQIELVLNRLDDCV